MVNQTANYSIILTWSMPISTTSECVLGYNIYRKMEGETSFVKIGTTLSYSNMVYYDSNIIQSTFYSYFVEAYGLDENSGSSNIVTVQSPSYPQKVTNFTASHSIPEEVFISWNNVNQNLISTNLYKRIVSPGSTWDVSNPYIQFYSNESYYFDYNVNSGTTYHYMMMTQNNIGFSDAVYDFVKIPYRDISTSSPVCVEIIEVNHLQEVEPFIQGRPEFRISVGNGSKPSGAVSAIVTNKNFDFDPFGLWQPVDFAFEIFSYPDNKLFDWNPNYWEDMVSIKLVELDEHWLNIKTTFNYGVKVNNKEKEEAVLEKTTVGTLDVELDKNSDDCGTDYLYFFEHPNQTLDAYDYGIKIYIGDGN